jgi:hypothetical protein
MRRGRGITIRRNSTVNWSITRVGNVTILRVIGAGFGRKLSHGLNLIKERELVVGCVKCKKNIRKRRLCGGSPD